MLHLAGSILVVSDDGRVIEPGDTLAMPYPGVFQGVRDDGFVTVARGPGHVETGHPSLWGLAVTAVATCGCAVTVAHSSGVRRHAACTDHPGMIEYRVPGIPELDDLI